MSAKIKFPSTSSTPTKSIQTSSPTKSSKYKNFLTAVLTPSQTKKWLKRKKSIKSEASFKEEKLRDDDDKNPKVSGDVYQSIDELQMKEADSIIYPSPVPSTKFSENICESHVTLSDDREQNSFIYSEEPVYATINKKKKNKIKHSDISCKNSTSHHGLSYEENESGNNTSDGEIQVRKDNSSNKSLIEDQKEEIKLLTDRMKELTKENRELRKDIETLLKNEKRKEDSLHANLKLKITQLEADTHKEVNYLSEQIKIFQMERKVLSDQIQILHEENKLLKKKNSELISEIQNAISPEFMAKKMDEQEMLLNQIKKEHVKKVKLFQEENEVLMESKIALMSEVEDLKGKNQVLMQKNETLRISEQKLLQERNQILIQLEESKQMQQEAENMLISLLKISETISIERDILQNKSTFQDHQQKLLQSSMVDYSLNMGRLQEHISTLNKEKFDELQKLKSGELQRNEDRKKFYEKQLELLQSKILSQSNIINDLENEKRKLEMQLESLWHAVSSEKFEVRDER